MADTDVLLEFRTVQLVPRHEGEPVLDELELALGPGELVTMLFEEDQVPPTLLDTAEGLRRPGAGAVRFKSTSWEDMSPRTATGYRARIGRVFPESEAWVSNLDVMENITLAARHHGHLPVEELEKEALEVATRLGMDVIPRTRPAWTSRRDLRRAQWARALLGEKDLLLLEHPCAGMRAEDADLAIQAVLKQRAKGAAVFWITEDPGMWNKESIRPDRKFRVQGQTITEVRSEV